ncbi:MAG TPA: hypothetical protein VE074_00015 [Jatrophihabitantaceae bacterium]|nr:hypothetical protein [Jatrophihabitantaceae bacterium]
MPRSWREHPSRVGSPAGELAAIRAAGYLSIGQVFGSCVFRKLPGIWAYCGFHRARTAADGYRYSPGVDAPRVVGAAASARRVAMQRLLTACADVGGTGVVDVRYTETPRGPEDLGLVEALVSGVAVRDERRQPVGADRLFSCGTGAAEFAALALGGWRPISVVFTAAALLRHDDNQTVDQQQWRGPNVEIEGCSVLDAGIRARVRSSFERQVRETGGDGLLLHDLAVTFGRRGCAGMGNDHHAEAYARGTVIKQVSRRSASTPVSVLPLNRVVR